jgi:hypothetical protein
VPPGTGGAIGTAGGSAETVGYGWAIGMWRSLVARLLWEQEAPGSSPGIPTKFTGH